jgi:hypothetical protein
MIDHFGTAGYEGAFKSLSEVVISDVGGDGQLWRFEWKRRHCRTEAPRVRFDVANVVLSRHKAAPPTAPIKPPAKSARNLIG